MTHLLDSSALLAHYLGEPGREEVQSLFENTSAILGVSILALFEFDSRLQQLGMGAEERENELAKYRALLDEIVNVDEPIRIEAMKHRISASARISAMDVLIAASASLHTAKLIYRDPHFLVIPESLLQQEFLPLK